MAELVIKLVNGELAGKTMQQLQKEVAAANTEFKKAEIGTQAYVDASKKLKDASDRMADAKKQAQGLGSASDILKKAFANFPGAQQFQAIGAAFNQARAGVGGLTSSFGLLRGAIAATGIVALVLAVTALVGWFAKTDAGATMIAGVFKALGNTVDVLMSKLWNIGDTLKQLFTHPLDFFKELGTDIAKAAKDGYEFESVMDGISDRARELAVQDAETQKVVEQLILQSKNVGLTYKERIALLDEAGRREIQNHEDQLVNAKALEAELEKDFQRAKARGTDTDELDQKRKDATIARINLERESIKILELVQNRRTALQEKQKAEDEKAAADKKKADDAAAAADKKAFDDRLKAIETAENNIEDLRVAAMEEGLQKEIAQAELDTQRKIESLQGTSSQILEQRKLLEEVGGQEIQAIRDKYNKLALDQDKKAAIDQNKIDRDKANVSVQLANQRLENEQAVVGGLGDLLTENIKDEKEAKAIKKTLGLIDIGINLEKELAANALAAAANPLNAFTFGAAGAAQLAAADTASYIRAGISLIKVAAFKKGGITGISDGVLDGPSHDDGGIPLLAEGGEIILTKGVFNDPWLRSLASQINVAGGGRSFASGGPTSPFDSRGPIQSGALQGSGSSIDELATAVLKMAQEARIANEETSKRIDRIQVHNNVQDTAKGISVVNKLKAEVDV